jgi:ATP-dependent DNA helicase PIF1
MLNSCAAFVNILNEMRFGRLSQSSTAKFKSLSREIEYGDGLGPTELWVRSFVPGVALISSYRFPRREDVERANHGRMSSLDAQEKDFFASDTGTISDPAQREKMLSNFMAPKKLTLRIGAQVMLIKNMDESLVNGSMGKVLRFANPRGPDPDDADNNGRPKPERMKAATNDMLVPVVEFLLPNKIRREVFIAPEVWKVELPNGEVQVSRTQVTGFSQRLLILTVAH